MRPIRLTAAEGWAWGSQYPSPAHAPVISSTHSTFLGSWFPQHRGLRTKLATSEPLEGIQFQAKDMVVHASQSVG